MNEKNEQLKAVLSDEAFVKTLLAAENAEAVQKLLADKGVEMDLTEIEIMGEILGALADGTVTEDQLRKLENAGELSEDELAEAAGGGESWLKRLFCDEQHYHHVERFGNGSIGGVRDGYTYTFSAAKTGKIIGGVLAVAATAYVIATHTDEIKSGAISAYNWVSDNITRW